VMGEGIEGNLVDMFWEDGCANLPFISFHSSPLLCDLLLLQQEVESTSPPFNSVLTLCLYSDHQNAEVLILCTSQGKAL
jgi:hypothetical protein